MKRALVLLLSSVSLFGQTDPLNKEHVAWTTYGELRAGDSKLYLAEGPNRTLIAQTKPGCKFAGKELCHDRILVSTSCSKLPWVVDRKGTTIYELPSFQFADFLSNSQGTRFAVYERGYSLWHKQFSLADVPYDRMRLLVYSTSDGKKLVDYLWKAEMNEITNSTDVHFSADGKTVFLDREPRNITWQPIYLRFGVP